MFPVDAFRPTLVKIVALLRQQGVRFHLTGGITTMTYGEPRLTQDIDIVVDNSALAGCLDDFLASLEQSDFLFDASAIRSGVEDHGMFQLLDSVETLKLDMYPRELVPGELDRSESFELFDDLTLPVSSLPDSAASKLAWVSRGSHKGRQDVRLIYQYASDDQRSQIRDLASEMGLADLLERVLSESDEPA